MVKRSMIESIYLSILHWKVPLAVTVAILLPLPQPPPWGRVIDSEARATDLNGRHKN